VPLRDDLLNPIPGDNPSGANLRYEKVYDQIKEARTEDDDSIPSGAWQRTIKKADYAVVIKLAGEALATRSKDLQLAAWLSEAIVKREGIGQVQPCLQLFQDLQNQFWDTIYPLIDEDGDVGMRATPIEWACNRLADILREAPITKSGLSYFNYKDSQSVGLEAETEYNDAKREARAQAIADGKTTGEEFDKAFTSTPKSWYVAMEESFRAAGETLDNLQSFSEEKYGDDGPAVGKLRRSLEEVGQVVSSLLNEKRKTEPDEPSGDEVVEEAEPEAEAESYSDAAPAAAATRPKAGKSLSAEPADRDDAISRVRACATFLQKDNPASPIAYLLQSAIRFGEMREAGSWASYDFLVPPSTEQRQNLKRLASEQIWDELLSASIATAGEPCGRAWLDVQRYIWKASTETSNAAITSAVVASVQAIVKDIPELLTWTLSDDTPTANPETQRWLEVYVILKPPEPVESGQAAAPEPVYTSAAQQNGTGEEAEPDILEVAKGLMSRGKLGQAIQLLMRDASQQPSGRARFLRRLQIAQLCMSARQDKVAHPVLEELVKEIDQRQLEDWEDSEMIAPPFSLLLKCLDAAGNTTAREAIFARLCRIDPSAAMDISR
jgi:type VI secretion system protein ImpA